METLKKYHLHLLMKKYHYTAKALADEIGASPSSISNWTSETDKEATVSINKRSFQKLLKVFPQCTPDYLSGKASRPDEIVSPEASSGDTGYKSEYLLGLNTLNSLPQINNILTDFSNEQLNSLIQLLDFYKYLDANQRTFLATMAYILAGNKIEATAIQPLFPSKETFLKCFPKSMKVLKELPDQLKEFSSTPELSDEIRKEISMFQKDGLAKDYDFLFGDLNTEVQKLRSKSNYTECQEIFKKLFPNSYKHIETIKGRMNFLAKSISSPSAEERRRIKLAKEYAVSPLQSALDQDIEVLLHKEDLAFLPRNSNYSL